MRAMTPPAPRVRHRPGDQCCGDTGRYVHIVRDVYDDGCMVTLCRKLIQRPVANTGGLDACMVCLSRYRAGAE